MTDDNLGESSEGTSRRPRTLPPKPVKIDEEYEVDVTETSQRGDGIARIEGLVVFIPKGKVGDHLRIRIARISRKFAEAQVIEKGQHDKEDTGPI